MKLLLLLKGVLREYIAILSTMLLTSTRGSKMDWSSEQLEIIKKYTDIDITMVSKEKMWRANSEWKDRIPLEKKRFKCYDCNHIISSMDIEEKGECPVCKSHNLVEMCPLDHCHCNCNGGKPIIGIEYCPICGDPICPICGTHDVTQVSRVTGYLQTVDGFNEGKKQELKDRNRKATEDYFK
jgi:hypothetical protein